MDEKDAKNLFLAWLVGSVVLFFAPFFAPGYVVLGNDRVSPFLAPFISSLLIVILVKLLMMVVSKYMKLNKASETSMGILLLLGYVLSLWLVARAALYVGFGIASFWVAIGIGVILATAEYWFSRISSYKVSAVKKQVKKSKRRR
ncbi:hypothetical protein HY407_05120 [Candidatus Gottesmanbacteria bacterium]|nr:hypothetical protein [Candidatus Gottesmanbacteria bacterium]